MSDRIISVGNPSFGLKRAIDRFRPSSSNIDTKRREMPPKPAINEAEMAVAAQARRTSSQKLEPSSSDAEQWPLPGLAPMTRVRTSFGDVHAIALRKGDEALLRSGEYKPILWINRIKLDEHILNLKPDSNPVVLAPGSLGMQAPANEIMVSPRQVICADDRSGLSSEREAAMLVSRPGVRRLRETSLSYTMFHLGESADVYCEGLYLRFPLEA